MIIVSTPKPISEETIFSTALSCAPTERATYLEKACAGDSAMRQRIENSLAAAQTDD